MAKRKQQPKRKGVTPKQPRQAGLPGVEDKPVRELNAVAADYAEIRDQRMALTQQEITLKDRTMRLMKKHGRTKYASNGITIEIEPGEETIRVRVKAPVELPADSDVDAPSAPPDDALDGAEA